MVGSHSILLGKIRQADSQKSHDVFPLKKSSKANKTLYGVRSQWLPEGMEEIGLLGSEIFVKIHQAMYL